MGDHCECGCEINDHTEICPHCGANIRAMRAEKRVDDLSSGNAGYRDAIAELEAENTRLRKVADAATALVSEANYCRVIDCQGAEGTGNLLRDALDALTAKEE